MTHDRTENQSARDGFGPMPGLVEPKALQLMRGINYHAAPEPEIISNGCAIAVCFEGLWRANCFVGKLVLIGFVHFDLGSRLNFGNCR